MNQIVSLENQLTGLKKRVDQWDEKNWFQRVFSKEKLTREQVEHEVISFFDESLFAYLKDEKSIELNHKVVNLFVNSRDLFNYEQWVEILIKVRFLEPLSTQVTGLLDEMISNAKVKLENLKRMEILYSKLLE